MARKADPTATIGQDAWRVLTKRPTEPWQIWGTGQGGFRRPRRQAAQRRLTMPHPVTARKCPFVAV